VAIEHFFACSPDQFPRDNQFPRVLIAAEKRARMSGSTLAAGSIFLDARDAPDTDPQSID